MYCSNWRGESGESDERKEVRTQKDDIMYYNINIIKTVQNKEKRRVKVEKKSIIYQFNATNHLIKNN